jgi:transaldolase
MVAIEELLFQGVNLNITLLFGIDAYRETFHAYMRAQERRAEARRPLEPIASVASFFLSRIDVLADCLLRQRCGSEVSPSIRKRAEGLLGRVAVANAKLAYQAFHELRASERWQRLESQGARPQRVLWASTGTKDPAYSDVYWVGGAKRSLLRTQAH